MKKIVYNLLIDLYHMQLCFHTRAKCPSVIADTSGVIETASTISLSPGLFFIYQLDKPRFSLKSLSDFLLGKVFPQFFE